MTNYRYIGYGTTDSNGIATLEYDASGNALSHSYTGTGAGKLNIVASLSNPIASNSVKSEVYEIYDCTKYDVATTANNNSIWANNTDHLIRGENYSTITYSEEAVLIYTTISGDVGIEFDVYVNDITQSNFVSVRYGTTGVLTANLDDMGLNANTWYHIRVEIEDGYGTISNNVNGLTTSAELENYNRIYLRTNKNKSVSFKNFIVYAI